MAFNLSQHVLAAGRKRPDHPALVVPGRGRWSFAELLTEVEGLAGGLSALGLEKGSRVLLRLGNEPAFPMVYLAAIAMGLVPVPTSAQLTEAEITPMAQHIGARLCVRGAGIAVPDGVPCVGAGDLTGAPLPYDAWEVGDPGRLGYIVFTSGSGGRPKAVAHAHRAILARRMMHDGWYGLRPDDRVLHAGAFNWTYTLGTGLLDPWTVGATALIPADGTPVSELPHLLARYQATLFAAAPGVYRRLLREDWPGTPRLRHGLSAGERLPSSIRSAWRETTGTDLHEALGMSECSTFISGSPGRPAPEGSTGYPQAGRHVLVEDGRLFVRSDDPGLMLGYWDGRGPVAIAEEWFDTGDRVRVLPDGAFVHEGREDDILNPGGYRVSPQDVEAALQGLPVAELAIGTVDVGNETQVLAAFYVGDALDEDAANAVAAERLARYKQPRLWLRRDALPRNANGKLIRKALR